MTFYHYNRSEYHRSLINLNNVKDVSPETDSYTVIRYKSGQTKLHHISSKTLIKIMGKTPLTLPQCGGVYSKVGEEQSLLIPKFIINEVELILQSPQDDYSSVCTVSIFDAEHSKVLYAGRYLNRIIKIFSNPKFRDFHNIHPMNWDNPSYNIFIER